MEEANKMKEGAAVIDVNIPCSPNENLSCVISMKQKLASMGGNDKSSLPFTICRVPSAIRQSDESAYDPKIISIGPYHHRKPKLQLMEDHKWRYLHTFLDRNPNIRLESYIMMMKDLEVLSRSCYSGNIDMSSDLFVEMMVLDSCFIIEILLKQEKLPAATDLIYSESWILPLIAQDMLLLENQLPFFVLERSFALHGNSSSLSELASGFFEHIVGKNDKIPPTSNILHLLHLIHSRLLPKSQVGKIVSCMDYVNLQHHEQDNILPTILRRSVVWIDPKPPKYPMKIPPADALRDAGIKFCLKDDSGSFLEVEFKNGRMEMPLVSVYHSTNSLFRNFIAFEQCFPCCGSHFTSYAIFMDSIINTETDVVILNKADIIEHCLGSDQDVAILFNNLCNGIAFDFKDSFLNDLFKDVIDYMETPWHRWHARLMHDYFSNPWASLSAMAAIVVIFLTFVQTYISLYGYFKPPS
ncbi:UPF0481 protein At3g47200-like [Magnolia sinica]|uniref:UPF0481 protein At3g47200-like n=1 Tax=Magnolia sinica TaxID=86752 RepID=UPI00265B5AB3|nr:UPF0481 protein At3g47200-like [Magnolia sinica]